MTTTTRTEIADEIGSCSCGCRFARGLRPSVHDDLLEWANGRSKGAGEPLYYFTEQLMKDQWVPGHLPWVDFPAFVSEHNWEDPAGVTHFAGAVDVLIREAVRTGARNPERLDPQIAAGFEARLDALTEDLDELIKKVKRHQSNRSKAAS